MEMLISMINGIVVAITILGISKFLLNKEYSFNLKNTITIALFGLILSVNYLIVDNFLKVILVYLDYIMLNTIIYKEPIERSTIISFIEYINVLISEGLVGLICSLVIVIIPKLNSSIIENNILLNALIIVIAYNIAKKFQHKYKNMIETVTKNSTLVISFISLMILICMSSLFHKIKLSNWQLNNSFLLNIVIIIIVGIIGIFVVVQRLAYDKKDKQYKDLAKYSEINAELLEEYSMLNHEHKNQLLIISNMVDKKNKQLSEYITGIINKKETVKFKWIRDLNNINFSILKSFINYKILEMKSEGIQVNVTISKDCKKYNLNMLAPSEKDKIYSIIGIYLDNAREACIESENKKVVINGYLSDDKMYIEIANTYNGKIDIKKINNYGYTSKGIGHGTGLYMVQKIIQDSNLFNTSTRINDDYFIQTLIIVSKNISIKKQ